MLDCLWFGHGFGIAAVKVIGKGLDHGINLREGEVIFFGDISHIVIFRIGINATLPGRVFYMSLTPWCVYGPDLPRKNGSFYRIFAQTNGGRPFLESVILGKGLSA